MALNDNEIFSRQKPKPSKVELFKRGRKNIFLLVGHMSDLQRKLSLAPLESFRYMGIFLVGDKKSQEKAERKIRKKIDDSNLSPHEKKQAHKTVDEIVKVAQNLRQIRSMLGDKEYLSFVNTTLNEVYGFTLSLQNKPKPFGKEVEGKSSEAVSREYEDISKMLEAKLLKDRLVQLEGASLAMFIEHINKLIKAIQSKEELVKLIKSSEVFLQSSDNTEKKNS